MQTTVSVRLPDKLLAWTRAEAQRRHLTVADIIREALWTQCDG